MFLGYEAVGGSISKGSSHLPARKSQSCQESLCRGRAGGSQGPWHPKGGGEYSRERLAGAFPGNLAGKFASNLLGSICEIRHFISMIFHADLPTCMAIFFRDSSVRGITRFEM